jgi:hypothetical protein
MGLNEISYVNPASFQPKLSDVAFGPMGGLKYYNDNAQYDQLMGVTNALQQLGLQHATQQQSEYMRGVPLRNQEQDNQLATSQGQAPFMRQLAESGAKTTLAGQKFDRDTKFSAANANEYLEHLKQTGRDREYANAQRMLSLSYDAAQGALELSKNDPIAAMNYMDDQMQKAQTMGIKLPQALGDPRNWQRFVDSGVNKIPHLQRMEEIEKTGTLHNQGTLAVAQTNAAAHVKGAEITAAGNRPFSENQEIPFIQQKIANLQAAGKEVPEELKNQLAQAVERAWDNYSLKNPDITSLEIDARSHNKKKAAEAKATLKILQENFVQRRLGRNVTGGGVGTGGAAGAATGGGGSDPAKLR